jgi:acyl-coenzyme A thioesterase PaaI-like protein
MVPTPSDTARDTARRLADEVRALTADLHAADATADALDRATRLVAEARAALDGAPRVRWYEVDGDVDEATRRRLTEEHREHSLYRGAANPLAPPLTVATATRDDGTPIVVGAVRLDRSREGPPRSVHGGLVAGLFDDLLGGTLALAGAPASVTGRLTVRYRRPTPIDTDLEFEAWVDHQRGRRLTARALCRAGGTVTAEAEALFIGVDLQRLGT